jgi:hypothetical protein
MIVIMQVAAADRASAHSQQHLAGPDPRGGALFDSDVAVAVQYGGAVGCGPIAKRRALSERHSVTFFL